MLVAPVILESLVSVVKSASPSLFVIALGVAIATVDLLRCPAAFTNMEDSTSSCNHPVTSLLKCVFVRFDPAVATRHDDSRRD